ncbi:hypothetical protein D3C81_1088860 [compost metagenome]
MERHLICFTILTLPLGGTAIAAGEPPMSISSLQHQQMDSYSLALGEIAQYPSIGKSCAAILRGGPVYDQHQYTSDRNRVEQFYNWACFSEFESSEEMKKSAGDLGISLGSLEAKVSFSDDRAVFKRSLTEWCRSAYSYLSEEAAYTQFVQTINQGITNALGSCIEAERQVALTKVGAYVQAIPLNQYLDSFGVTVDFRQPIPNEKNKILSIEPKEVNCEIGGTAIKPTPDKPYELEVNSAAMTCYKNGAIPSRLSFNTYPSNASPWVVLPGTQDDSMVKEIQQRQKGLAQSIGRINDRFDGLKVHGSPAALSESILSDHNYRREAAMVTCPNGSYVAGIRAIDTDGGNRCVNCIGGIQIDCRPLNVK